MKNSLLRLAIILTIVILLYQKSDFAHIIGALLMMIEVLQSYKKSSKNYREEIISQLMDKLSISSIIIVLVDQKVLSSAVVAWVLGSMFILAGVDLLKGSLKTELPDLIKSKYRNMLIMMNVFFIVFIYSIHGQIEVSFYNRMRFLGGAIIVIITILFVVKCFMSEEVKKLLKEA